MKKKKSGGGGANWMDTYGDMVTLLLCFFVLLYSMSTISEDKWKAIVQSFNPNAIPAATEIEGGNKGPSADSPGESGVFETTEEEQAEIDAVIEELYEALQSYAASSGMSDSISVKKDGSGRVFVSFRDTAFFDGDSAVLRRDAYPILDAMCEILARAGMAIDQVRILGHTAQADPDKPNTTVGDRTLSSSRANNVLIYIQDHTLREELDPGKLISEGWGQWHPVATNETPEGRAENRRVELIISGRNLEEELGSSIESYTTTTTATSNAN